MKNTKTITPRKKRRIVVIALLVVVAVAGGLFLKTRTAKTGNLANETTYTTAQVEEGRLTVSLSGTGTLEPADAYQVTTLISGEILNAPFEEDQQVKKDDVLFTFDGGQAQTSLDQASISTEQARLSYTSAAEAMSPKASMSGTVQEVFVSNGDTVNAGSPLLRIVDSGELTVDMAFYADSTSNFYVGQPATVYVGEFFDTVTGTVKAVSNNEYLSNGTPLRTVQIAFTNPGVVSEGTTASATVAGVNSYGNGTIAFGHSETVYAQTSGTVKNWTVLAGNSIQKGDTICSIDSETARNQLKNAQMGLQSAKISQNSAKDALDNYIIKAPISGTVIEKNFKKGDTVEGGSSGNMAVIYDLSYLKFQMNVDELDIAKIEVGQAVTVTAAAVEGETFTGVVDRISINGTTQNGVTTYPVTILLEEYGKLLPGMNVDAEIVLEATEETLLVPAAAVQRGNYVLVTEDSPSAGNAVTEEEKTAPEGYRYVPVTVGLTDGDKVEILSGLTKEDTVAYIEERPDESMQPQMIPMDDGHPQAIPKGGEA